MPDLDSFTSRLLRQLVATFAIGVALGCGQGPPGEAQSTSVAESAAPYEATAYGTAQMR